RHLGKLALRPALPGAVALGRRRFSAPTLSPAFLSHPFCCPSLAVFNWPDTGPNSGLGDLGRVLSPPWGRTRHTGPNGGQQGASQSGLLLGAKKPLSDKTGQRLWGL